MKKFFYSTIAVLIVIAVYFVIKPNPVKVDSVVIQQGTFNETLTSEGKIRSRNKHIVYALASGNLEKITLKVGDSVQKGQVVTTLIWDRHVPVKSPIEGVISKIFRESEGPIQRGEPIFEVSSVSELEVVAELLTPDAVRLNQNGEAQILNWGGEGHLTAEIFQISRAGAVKISALGVEEERTEVKLIFKKIPPELKNKFGDNYHVDVIFLISQEADVLSVPLGALFKSGDKWAVYVIQNGKAMIREIAISKKNDKQALVKSGLKEGEMVILFPGDKIRENTRVESTTLSM